MYFKRPPKTDAQLLRDINDESFMNKKQLNEIVESARRAEEDADQTERLKARECKLCFYIRKHRIGGAAMTDAECQGCQKVMGFSSTATDKFCRDCSDKYRVCTRCGADMELASRRRKLTY